MLEIPIKPFFEKTRLQNKEKGSMLIPNRPWAVFFSSRIFLVGCSRTPPRSSEERSIQPGSIRSLAILPLRNAELAPGGSRALNRSVSQTFGQKNPNVKIVRPTESMTLINQAGLADKYSEFLGDYARSGVPNVNTIRAIGGTLRVDAILQGEVFNIEQVDGDYDRNVGSTSLTIRYFLMGTHDGIIMWEVMSNGTKSTATPFESAPPVHQVILKAQNWILTSLPELGK
jgi:hypothetical protein